MLGVDQQPVVAAVRQLLRNGRTVRVQEQAHFRFAFAQLFLEFGATERGFGHSRILLSGCQSFLVYRRSSISKVACRVNFASTVCPAVMACRAAESSEGVVNELIQKIPSDGESA